MHSCLPEFPASNSFDGSLLHKGVQTVDYHGTGLEMYAVHLNELQLEALYLYGQSTGDTICPCQLSKAQTETTMN